jgi:pimeloyl-ACP methyl ester carboxylesterase
MTIPLLLLLAVLLGGGWLWTPDKPRAELEAIYAAPPSRFATVAGIRLHIRDTGPASGRSRPPTLLLLHGFASSLQTWDDWAQRLQGDWRVIRIDLPGAGLTGPDPTGDYGDARSVAIIQALLDELQLERVTLIGHSMGGRLAWRFAADHPERVDKLVLIAPDGYASPGFEYGKPPEVGITVQAMRFVLPRALVRASLAPAYADPDLLTDAVVTRYHEMLLAPGVRGALIERTRQLVLQEPTVFLQRITAPTLLMWGERDALIPPANAQDYLKALPRARLVTFPAVGHLPHEEAPALSLPALETFLRE